MRDNKIYSWSSGKPSGNPQFDDRMKERIDELHAEILNSGEVKVIENYDINIAFEDLPIILFKSNSNEWETPQDLFDKLDKEFHFTLDPCATKENAKCEKYYTIEEDGLSKSWAGEIVFMNPPYGREIGKWAEKAFTEYWEHGITIVCLVPSRTDTVYWHKYFMNGEIRFIRGRVKFSGGKSCAPFPSAIIVFYGWDDTENNKLLSCPFCGLKTAMLSKGIRIKDAYDIYCTNEDCFLGGCDYLNKSEIINKWNKRA